MNCSFTPQGDWFVFDEDTDATLTRGFNTKAQAIGWIVRQRVIDAK